jgi:uncharacterized membrane protein YcaP (DUF421 family)
MSCIGNLKIAGKRGVKQLSVSETVMLWIKAINVYEDVGII